MFRSSPFSLRQLPTAATRLRQSIRMSPPLGLMVLTLVVLLLALGTARAGELAPDTSEGAKWRYGRAVADLTGASQAEFASYVAPEMGLIVEHLYNGQSEGRRIFTEDLTSEDFERNIVPVLQSLAELGEIREAAFPALCDEGGTCVVDTWSGTLTLKFATKAEGVRILSLRLDAWDEGC